MESPNRLERSHEKINIEDLNDLYKVAFARIEKFFRSWTGEKYLEYYDFHNPIVAFLGQGAALHFVDGRTGVKDFDVWILYPFAGRPLPCRTVWRTEFPNRKFGVHPTDLNLSGRRVDVMVRSIRNYELGNPRETISSYFGNEKTPTSYFLKQKAVIGLFPSEVAGKPIWQSGKLL